MILSHDHTGAVLPDDVNMLDAVFTEILPRRDFRRDCEAAELIARRLDIGLPIWPSSADELRKMVAAGD